MRTIQNHISFESEESLQRFIVARRRCAPRVAVIDGRSKKSRADPTVRMPMTNHTLSPVAVVGAGALGCLFGGMLARAGAAVTLIGRAHHVAAIRRDGLRFESRGAHMTIPV